MKSALKIFFKIVILLFFVMFLLIKFTVVYADTTSNFSIEALDEDGNSNHQGYYHLIGNPGETKGLQIKVYNSSIEEITVNVEVNPASTNQNGLPSYLFQEVYDDSLLYPLNELVSIGNSQITIPSREFVVLDVGVTFPDKEWKGDILGGVRFTEESKQESTATVTHQIAYTVGILLNMIDGDTIENILHLNDASFGQRNYRNYVEANIQNSEAVMIKNLTTDAKIYKKNESTPIYEATTYDMRMAPNSNFNLGIPTGDQPLVAGSYILELHMTADGKEYQFQKEFSVSEQEARNLNASAVNVEANSNFALYSLIVGLGIIIVLLLGLFYRQKHKGGLKR